MNFSLNMAQKHNDHCTQWSRNKTSTELQLITVITISIKVIEGIVESKIVPNTESIQNV